MFSSAYQPQQRSDLLTNQLSAMNVVRQRTLNGHTAAVNAVRFTSDGSYCMTCSDDKTVRLWNPHKDDVATEGNALLIKTYSGVHGYQIFDISISKDKTKFATAGGDRTSFLWDVASGRIIRRLQGHSQRVNAVHLNEAGTLQYTGSYDKTLCVWDLKSNMREPIQTLSEFRDSVTSVTTTRNQIIASSVDGAIRVYDIRMGELHTDELNYPVTHMQLSHDQKCLTAACLGGDVHLMDVNTGVLLQRYSGRVHNSFKLESSFCHDATHICGASEDGSVKFWHQVTGNQLPVQYFEPPNRETPMGAVNNSASSDRMHKSPIYSVANHPSLNIFVAASSDGSASCCTYEQAHPM